MTTHETSARDTPGEAPRYRSGAAARLAGLPVETLRVWERRYGIVGPGLSARGQRQYTADQVKRLTLVKRLVDLGNPVSALAPLSDEALEQMHATARALSATGARAGPLDGAIIRIALIGESFSARLAAELGRETALDIVATCTDIRQAPHSLAGARAEVVVVELPALLADAVEAIDAACATLEAGSAVVLYRFGQRDIVRKLRAQGTVVARMPMDSGEIETLCRAALAAHPPAAHDTPDPAPAGLPDAPRFDEPALAELARASNTVYCECPRHLVELLRMLGSFERYSIECENRGRADAALHRDLARAAGEARALLEAALVRVARAEGIPLPRSSAQAR